MMPMGTSTGGVSKKKKKESPKRTPVQKSEVKPKGKQPSPGMRLAHAGMGAIFLVLSMVQIVAGVITSKLTLKGGAKDDDISKDTVWKTSGGAARGKVRMKRGDDLGERKEWYEVMERKGFRVTKDTGCLIPHEQYSQKGKGATIKGYQRSFFAAFGFLPKQYKPDEAPRSDDGRDCSPQLSHLCHRRWCCRPDHISYEHKWRNFARNWCTGPMPSVRLPNGRVVDTCGCSLQLLFAGREDLAGPPCIRAYEVSSDVPPSSGIVLCETFEQARDMLVSTGFAGGIGLKTYTDRDTKSKLRKLAADKSTKKEARKLVKAFSPRPVKNLLSNNAKVIVAEQPFSPPPFKGVNNVIVVEEEVDGDDSDEYSSDFETP